MSDVAETDVVGEITELHRFPVKSMLGERLDAAEVTEQGITGDRAWAVVDRSDGRIATGKHPRKWAKLLQVAAAYVDGPGSPIMVTFPDGDTVEGEAAIADALSAFLGRDVALAAQAEEGQVAEEVWPRIDGLAPPDIVESMSGGRLEGDEPVSEIPMGSMAPPGSFFDLTTLSVMTTATLRRLAELEPDLNFDVRRYRPNFVVDVPGAGFVENDWVGHTLRIGTTAEARVDLPTMRCVMTTLARQELEQDRRSLQAIARHNRLEIFGGQWACAGVYASATVAGEIRVGDPVMRVASDAV